MNTPCVSQCTYLVCMGQVGSAGSLRRRTLRERISTWTKTSETCQLLLLVHLMLENHQPLPTSRTPIYRPSLNYVVSIYAKPWTLTRIRPPFSLYVWVTGCSWLLHGFLFQKMALLFSFQEKRSAYECDTRTSSCDNTETSLFLFGSTCEFSIGVL
jgi:hypothetical protein